MRITTSFATLRGPDVLLWGDHPLAGKSTASTRYVLCTKHVQEATSASATFENEDPALIARLIQFLYANAYTVSSISTSGARGCGQFVSVTDPYGSSAKTVLLHTKMYYLAERLMLDDLKEHARKLFTNKYFQDSTKPTSQSNPARFDEEDAFVINAVYDGDHASERGLRHLALLGIQIDLSYYDGYADETFRSFISSPENTEFANDIIQYPLLPREYKCTHCGCRGAILHGKCECGAYARCSKRDCIDRIVQKAECIGCWSQGCMVRVSD